MMLQWVKGHARIKGNEEADKLAKEGTTKPLLENINLTHPPNQTTAGARLTEMEQKDFYKILCRRCKIPLRQKAIRNVGIIQACTVELFNYHPMVENVWKVTRHKDFTRKT